MVKRPILVTGMHRSGTTFTGKVLNLSPEVIYIQEPLNKAYGCEGVPCWYPYYGSDCGSKTKELVPKILNYSCKYNIHHNEKDLIFKKVFKTLFGNRASLQMKYAKLTTYLPGLGYKRPLIKDPLALLMSEYFYNQFNAQVVILVRHPAAIYYSLKRLGWRFDFNNLIRQKEFMERYGSDLVDKLYNYDKFNLVEEVGYLWVLLHRAVKDFKKRYPGWYVVTHEDLCQQPIRIFKEMFRYLGLTFHNSIETKLANLTNGQRVDAQNNMTHDFNRNAKLLSRYWENKLATDEIKELRIICEKEMLNFYDCW